MPEYDTAERILKAGGNYHHRTCRACKEPIYFTLLGRQLCLISCRGCRAEKESNVFKISWEVLEHLLHRHDHHEVR